MIEDEKKEGISLGIEQGTQQRLEQDVEAMIDLCQGFGISKTDTAATITEKLSLSPDIVESYIRRYWRE